MCLLDDEGGSRPFSVSGLAADVNSVNFSMKMGPAGVKRGTNT